MKTKFLASTALLAGCLFAGSAQAYVVETLEGGLPPPGNYALDCSDGCFGFIGGAGTYALDTTPVYNAQAYDLGNSSETEELAFLNTILSTAGLDQVTSAYKPGTVGPTASTNKEYFSIKIGNQTTFYKNMTNGTLDLTFLKDFGGGEFSAQAFSHLTEYGDPVPLPGAVWLFGSALLGLVSLNRRKRLAA